MEREGRGGSYHLASTSCYVSVTQVPRYEKGAAICITDFVWMLKVPVCSLACLCSFIHVSISKLGLASIPLYDRERLVFW